MRLLRVASTLVFAFTASAQPVLLTGPVTLNPGAATITPTSGGDPVPLATAEITVEGTRLTVNGPHTIASLTLRRSAGNVAAVVTHDANFVGGGVNGLSLTITGDLIVQGAAGSLVGSSIDVYGKGWPYQQGPGIGVGFGQGAGSSGHGGSGTTSYNGSGGGGTYGSAKHPVTFGTGAKSYPIGSPPGGGGCVRLIVGGTASIDGQVIAEGDFASFGFGGGGYTHAGSSGGSVWITAHALQGSGSITAHGGQGLTPGGGGRIAIECHIPIRPSFSGLIAAWGGHNGFGGSAATLRTSAGTVYLRSATGRGLFIIDGGTTVPSTSSLPNIAVGEAADPWGDLGNVDFHIRNGGAARIASGDVVSFAGDAVIDTGAKLELNSTLRAGGHATLGGAGAAVTISHAANTPNTLVSPGCMLDVVGDMLIAANATLNGDGRGYPPGQGPGLSPFFPNSGSAGHGGIGAIGYGGLAGGGMYGSPIEPITYGTGGVNQAAGGGAFRVVVGGDLTLDGRVSADAAGVGSDTWPVGSGGSVLLRIGREFRGTGAVSAGGGINRSGGAGGRIAVYANSHTFTGVLSAFGGEAHGGPGTIVRAPIDGSSPTLVLDSGPQGSVRINTIIETADAATGLPITWAGVTLRGTTWAKVPVGDPLVVEGDLTLQGTSTLNLNTTAQVAGNFVMSSTSTVTHDANTPGFHLEVGGDAIIPAGAKFDGDGKGYPPYTGPGFPTHGGGAGSGHGGRGGPTWQNPAQEGGGVYGSTTQPTTFGSGGVNQNAGGGAFKLTVAGNLTLDGTISVNQAGAPADAGWAASGGSVWITTGGVFSGSGTVRANGLASRSYGGGGRIALYYESSTFSGLLQAQSGLSPDLGGNMSCAAPGTVLRKAHAAAFPDVTLDAGCTGPQRAVSPSLMSELGTGLGSAEIRGGTQVRAGEPYIFNGDLTAIGPSTRIDATGGLFALGDISLTDGVRLTHTRGVMGFHLAAGGDMYIDAHCIVDADGLGYGPGQGPGSGGFSDCWPSSGGGGGHGGAGGIGWNVSGQCHTTPGGGAYGSAQSPIELGSAGGNTSYGCNPGDYAIFGGGAVRLSARGELRALCLVTARGLPGVFCASSHSSGAGAGGSIWLTGGGDVIAPNLRAHGGGYTTGGGPGDCYFLGGPGGGGRVAIYSGGTITGDFGLPGSTEQTATNSNCPDRSDPFARYVVRGGWAAPLRGDCACYAYTRPTDGWDGSLVLEEFAHPGGITAQPQSVQRPLGSVATFSISGEPGGPVGFEAAYQWRRNGIALRDGPQPGGSTVSGATSSDLLFDNLQESDAGTIDVIFFTASGPILSDAAQLSIGDPCPADFNQDGGIDGGDVEAFFAAWEMGDAAADVNQDGGIDGADVETFFAAWESGGCG